MRLAEVVPLAGVADDDVLALAARCGVGLRASARRARSIDGGPRARDRRAQPATSDRSSPEQVPHARVDGARDRGREAGAICRDDLERRSTASPGRPDHVRRPARRRRRSVLVAVSDRVTPGSRATTVGRLRRHAGSSVAMVTGDRRTTAEAIASSVGIPRVLGRGLPGGKVDEVERLRHEGHRVVFVGDGIERRTRPGAGRRRYRHGRRHRRRHRGGGCLAPGRRSGGGGGRDRAGSPDLSRHRAEPVLGVRVQRR